MKKVFFRTDCSATIGTGHLKRGLSLIPALLRYYSKPTLLINSDAHFLFPDLKDQFTTFNVPEFRSQQEEAEYLISNIYDLKDSLVIVDHYQLDATWERVIASAGNNVIAIDDINRTHFAHLVVDQNFRSDYSGWYQDNISQGKVLLGLNFCLIDHSYTSLIFSEYFDRARRLLVNFGGGNVKELIQKTICSYQQKLRRGWVLDLVVGNNLKTDLDLKNLIEGANFNYHSVLPTLATLMAASQCGLGAGGTSNWERLFVGLPSIVFTIADNQRQINQDLADAGYIIYLGEQKDYNFTHLPQAVNKILASPQKRLELHEKGRKLIDGRGPKRIAAEVVALEISLRKVQVDDSRTILNWRNDPNNRIQAINSSEISEEQHANWYAKILESSASDLLIASIEKEDFGILRFDYEGTEAKVSIYLNPQKHNSGLGLPLLIAGEDFLKPKKDIKLFIAFILNTNLRSQKIFSDAGYFYHQTEGDLQIWHKYRS